MTEAVLATLNRQGLLAGTARPEPAVSTSTPPDQPPLPSTIWALWQGDEPQIRARDRHQVQLLINTYDLRTNGFGAYWVGRAILLADTCLREKGRPLTLSYVRSILARWEQEDRWGSDRALEPLAASRGRSPKTRAAHDTPAAASANDTASSLTGNGMSGQPHPALATAPATSPVTLERTGQTHPALAIVPAAAPVTLERTGQTHPALAAYVTAFGRAPNGVQAAQIRATVTDQVLWHQVLTEWQANGWKEAAVAKMLDRYRKAAGLVAPAEPERPPSVRVIHEYPGLTMDEREIWIMRFHRAETPAAKRAVLARLAQEHPFKG
ncbi:MAG: hypothetical protein AB4911_16385 [Oscillochloridaceae bacterium umkhey_bin13]